MSQENNDFQKQALGKTPSAALAICGIIIALSLSFNIANINISEGINRWLAAKALATELEVQRENVPVDKELLKRVETLEEVVEDLKKNSHPPARK